MRSPASRPRCTRQPPPRSRRASPSSVIDGVPGEPTAGSRRGMTRQAAFGYRCLGLALGVLLLSVACATPVGVVRAKPEDVYRTLTRSVLSTGQLSPLSQQTLQRLGLQEQFETDPEAVLAQLRGRGQLDTDVLFTLAEASFLHADKAGRQDYYLAAAVYAYAFMRGARGMRAPAIDPRPRLAADLYNLGLTRGLAAEAPETPTPETAAQSAPPAPGPEPSVSEVILQDRTLALPFGQLELRGNPEDFIWSGYRLSRFLAVAEFQVRGLRNRYRQAGLGAPLAAELVPVGSGPEAERARRHIPPRAKVPVTAIVRFADVDEGIASGRLRGRLELYPADEATTVELEGRTVPLELEPSAALAYQLEGAPIWE